jgi:hypothetical protein
MPSFKNLVICFSNSRYSNGDNGTSTKTEEDDLALQEYCALPNVRRADQAAEDPELFQKTQTTT